MDTEIVVEEGGNYVRMRKFRIYQRNLRGLLACGYMYVRTWDVGL